MALFGRIKPIASAPHEHSGLAKTLSWPHLIALGIGATIGTGIYTLTGVGAGMAGPAVIASFAIAGLVVICAALAYTEMATLIPASGSAYTYTYSVIGEGLAWIVGWSLVLEYALAASAVAVGWSAHVQGFLDGALHVHIPATLAAGPMEGGVVNLLAVVISLVITGLLLIGTRESATVNILLVIVKIVALGAFVAFTLPMVQAGNYHPFAPFGVLAHEVNGKNMGVLAAAAVVFFAFYGFDAVSTSSEEVKNPKRDLTIGILGSMIICILIYMLVGASAVGSVSYASFSQSAEPLPFILRELHHPLVGVLVGAAAIVALPSVILVCIYGQSRIFFVMARDGLLPPALSFVDKRGLPSRITLITGVFVAIFAGLVPLNTIAELANAGTLLAFVCVSAAMIVMRVQKPELPRVFRTPAFWLVGPLAIMGCVWLFMSLMSFTKIAFIVWNLIGLIFYFSYGYWNSRVRKASAT